MQQAGTHTSAVTTLSEEMKLTGMTVIAISSYVHVTYNWGKRKNSCGQFFTL